MRTGEPRLACIWPSRMQRCMHLADAPTVLDKTFTNSRTVCTYHRRHICQLSTTPNARTCNVMRSLCGQVSNGWMTVHQAASWGMQLVCCAMHAGLAGITPATASQRQRPGRCMQADVGHLAHLGWHLLPSLLLCVVHGPLRTCKQCICGETALALRQDGVMAHAHAWNPPPPPINHVTCCAFCSRSTQHAKPLPHLAGRQECAWCVTVPASP